MLKINDNYYDIEIIDVITELKEQLELNNIFLFSKLKDLPTDLMVSCPFHKNGQERKPSCGIRKSDGFFHCFSCGASFSLDVAISYCFGYNDFGKFGWQWLNKNFLGELSEHRDLNLTFDRNVKKSLRNYISDKELAKYRYYHPYMYKRKLTDKVINLFDIGYDAITQAITFPVRDVQGNCLFIARRHITYKYFNYPKDVEKPLYGIYELSKIKPYPAEIYVCESMLDALTFWTHPNKYAVALNGLGTAYQYKQLMELPCRKLILATDNDEAGTLARYKLRKNVSNKIITEIVLPANRKDVNECTFQEIETLQEIF